MKPVIATLLFALSSLTFAQFVIGDLIRTGNIAELRALLSTGTDANVIERGGVTLLMIAVDEQQPEMVRLLLEAGADVNAQTTWGRTALMGATTSAVGDPLFEAGADLSAIGQLSADDPVRRSVLAHLILNQAETSLLTKIWWEVALIYTSQPLEYVTMLEYASATGQDNLVFDLETKAMGLEGFLQSLPALRRVMLNAATPLWDTGLLAEQTLGNSLMLDYYTATWRELSNFPLTGQTTNGQIFSAGMNALDGFIGERRSIYESEVAAEFPDLSEAARSVIVEGSVNTDVANLIAETVFELSAYLALDYENWQAAWQE